MKLTGLQLIEYYNKMLETFPFIKSIEDPFDEDDYEHWSKFTSLNGDKINIVGDDLFCSNLEYVNQGLQNNWANSLLLKVNQIGTLTETLDAVDLAHRANYRSMMSHRSGETEDVTIADLAVATNCGQIKTGAPSRTERVAKYNQLLRIEEELAEGAVFAGRGAFPRFKG